MAVAGDESGGLHVRLVGTVCFTSNSLVSLLTQAALDCSRSWPL